MSSWAELKDFMRQGGEVTYVDAHNRMGRGRGEACFESRDEMYNALDTLDRREIDGKEIRLYVKVRLATLFYLERANF